jgi:Holliday junction resolvase RusA-like endonuclease
VATRSTPTRARQLHQRIVELRGPPHNLLLKQIAAALDLVSHTSVLHHLNGNCKCGSVPVATYGLLYPGAGLHRSSWSFEVDGRPKPYVRARTRRGRYYTDPEYEAWRDRVAMLSLVELEGKRPLLQGPVAVAVQVFVHGHPGDPDNYGKGVMDALQGIFYDDDRRVKRLESVVERAASRGVEHARVWVGDLRG